MSENTGICAVCCSTPQVALTEYQYNTRIQNQTQYVYVSTIQGQIPNYVYKYKSETERILAKMGGQSLNCSYTR